MEKERARVTSVCIRSREQLQYNAEKSGKTFASAQWLNQIKPSWAERLSRNMALAAALVICVAGVRAVKENPSAQAVFETVQNQMEWELDDSLGKLSFVSNLLPEASMVFWNGATDIQVTAPVQGDIHHVWTTDEPYISMKGASENVYCGAAGEVMAVAHGENEEIILRIRHNDCWETVYGNLSSCCVSLGDRVDAGELIGKAEEQVYFELRQDGRKIDPAYVMTECKANP